MTNALSIASQAAWFLVAAGASSVATTWLIGWATSHGVFDVPNSRSSHTRVTPRGGGIAIVSVTTWASIVAAVFWPESRVRLAGLVVPALAIAAVSWLDDIRPLRNRIRFGVHLAAAATAAAVLGPATSVALGWLGTFDLGVIAAWSLTLPWIVGMTNAFNFMDGIDGIAGITAAVAGVGLAAAAGCLGLGWLAAVGLAFAGASLGFLTCNWPPARIFMGDVGSAFCGFVIAALPLAGGAASSRLVPIAAVAMWPFIFDTAFTLGRRLLNRENIFQAHRSHLYQRLVIAGWPHRAVSTLYGFLSAIAAAIAVAPVCGGATERTATTLAAATITVGMALLLALVFISEKAEGRKAPGASA